MKKLIAGLMAVVLILTGCGSKDNGNSGSDEKVLRFAGLDGGYGTDGWTKVAAAFEEKNPGVKIELQMEKNISEVLRPVITSGENIPDIIYLAVGAEGGLTDTMIAEKQILAIDDILDMEIPGEGIKLKDKIIEGGTDSLTTRPYEDGKLYLLPTNYGPCGLYFNQGLFEEKGWKVPTTWDEMWELAEKAEAEGIALFTYPTTGYFDAFFSSLLNAVVGPETYTKLMNYDVEAWESADVKEAFEIVGKLAKYTEKNTVSNANGEGFTKNQQLILDNKALFVPNGYWLPGEMKDAPRAEGFEWGFMAIPSAKAGEPAYSTTFTEQMYIPSGAENVELAKQFMAFAYSDEAVKIFYENGKDGEAGAVMPIKDVTKVMPEGDLNRASFELYDDGKVRANTVGFAALDKSVEGIDLTGGEGILYGTVNSVVSGDKTVDQWYEDFIANLKKVVEAQK